MKTNSSSLFPLLLVSFSKYLTQIENCYFVDNLHHSSVVLEKETGSTGPPHNKVAESQPWARGWEKTV